VQPNLKITGDKCYLEIVLNGNAEKQSLKGNLPNIKICYIFTKEELY
jgi:hypothetical protein